MNGGVKDPDSVIVEGNTDPVLSVSKASNHPSISIIIAVSIDPNYASAKHITALETPVVNTGTDPVISIKEGNNKLSFDIFRALKVLT